LIDRELSSLVAGYKSLHAAPELSRREEKTSAFLAGELRPLGFEVTEHVGRYLEPGVRCYGVVAVMRNGAGPTVLVRTDMDALPLEEQTGLPYASKARALNSTGQEVPVMHACGHDIHMSVFLGTARVLVALKGQWHGTLVMLGQPAEETGEGARAMLSDGLYARFPRPDYALALHDQGDFEAGKVAISPEYIMASSTSVDVTVRGIGGHGARPEKAKDPVVTAAQIVLGLQTIVSREIPPTEPAVVTVGSIHGGTKHNLIPDDVHLQITIRAFKEEIRRNILVSIDRICRGIASAAGIPDSLAPIVKVSDVEYTPATYNDPTLTQRLGRVFGELFGKENVLPWPPSMVAEDFSRYALDTHEIPTCLFWLGASDPAKVAESRKTGAFLPSLHSARFTPVPEPTIRTGVKAMTSAVLELYRK
jgi:hippurate hydrolase